MFSYAGQDNDLFKSLTIAENVEYGIVHELESNAEYYFSDSDRSLALENSVRDSKLDELVGRLPDGLQSNLGSNGRLFSGGERQRICLARAFYRQELLPSTILILDEGTSKLDAFTEDHVMNAIFKRSRRAMNSPTVILTAHRLKSIQNSDVIVVMKDGQIHQVGKHKELLQSASGWYARAWNIQQQQSGNKLSWGFNS
jgi:ABC-type branched-subunit amino acid transport system ATPase component